MSSILDSIVKYKACEIDAAMSKTPLIELQRQIDDVAPAQDFAAAVTSNAGVSLIAEVKRASPSQGIIRGDFDPVQIARAYAANGASCISVLTDAHFFGGSLEHLRAIRAEVDLPLLRKDFVLHEYQVYEARAAGADAVLLIAECLADEMLCELRAQVAALGMTPLVELYDPEYLPAVLDCGAQLIGINNRDLRTFETDLQHTVQVRAKLPRDKIVVSESGIFTHDHVRFLESAGIDAMLVGQSLMESQDIGAAVRSLLGK